MSTPAPTPGEDSADEELAVAMRDTLSTAGPFDRNAHLATRPASALAQHAQALRELSEAMRSHRLAPREAPSPGSARLRNLTCVYNEWSDICEAFELLREAFDRMNSALGRVDWVPEALRDSCFSGIRHAMTLLVGLQATVLRIPVPPLRAVGMERVAYAASPDAAPPRETFEARMRASVELGVREALRQNVAATRLQGMARRRSYARYQQWTRQERRRDEEIAARAAAGRTIATALHAAARRRQQRRQGAVAEAAEAAEEAAAEAEAAEAAAAAAEAAMAEAAAAAEAAEAAREEWMASAQRGIQRAGLEALRPESIQRVVEQTRQRVAARAGSDTMFIPTTSRDAEGNEWRQILTNGWVTYQRTVPTLPAAQEVAPLSPLSLQEPQPRPPMQVRPADIPDPPPPPEMETDSEEEENDENSLPELDEQTYRQGFRQRMLNVFTPALLAYAESGAMRVSDEHREVCALIDAVAGADEGVLPAAVAAVPSVFCCPITHSAMRTPTVLCDGHTYEASAIINWIKTKAEAGEAPTSPATGERLYTANMVVNHALRKAMAEWADGQFALAASLVDPTTHHIDPLLDSVSWAENVHQHATKAQTPLVRLRALVGVIKGAARRKSAETGRFLWETRYGSSDAVDGRADSPPVEVD